MEKAMKLSPLHFQLTIFVIEKWLADSPTPQVGESTTQQVGKYDNFGLFLRPSIMALYKKPLLYF
jgi:hypothetical protein